MTNTIENKAIEPLTEKEIESLDNYFPLTWPGEGKCTISWKNKETRTICAYNAHKTNSIKEAVYDGILTIGKVALASVPLGILALGAYNISDESVKNISRDIICSSPVTLPLVYAAKLALFGSHTMSGYGNYYKEPLFGAWDCLKLCGNWLKIAYLQSKGKIRKGVKSLPKDRVYYDVHGGP